MDKGFRPVRLNWVVIYPLYQFFKEKDDHRITKGQEKVVLFLRIGHVKILLSPTRPHKSNVYENTYFLFQNFFVFIFFPVKKLIKNWTLCFSTKKKAIRVVF